MLINHEVVVPRLRPCRGTVALILAKASTEAERERAVACAQVSRRGHARGPGRGAGRESPRGGERRRAALRSSRCLFALSPDITVAFVVGGGSAWRACR